jgi:two-component system, OmpR family, osmolarity sensor histidine kinase EnvZ
MALPSPPLFWRTFLLILLLIVGCLVATLYSFRAFEREPRARQIAQQLISLVNVTRSALLYSDPLVRAALLSELAENEGIRILPLETDDVVKPFADGPVIRLASERVLERLGPQTQVAEEVNGLPGAWVSFSIDGDAYWVYIERDLLAREAGSAWIRWALIATVLALLAAVAITRAVNRPLARLAQAARELGAGHVPAPLPELGPVEIREVNQSFNRMVADLGKIEQDRAVLLAGISHDLRTPLTRLRLELELNALPDSARQAMTGDIEQMDAIVRQFLDYARGLDHGLPPAPRTRLELAALVHEAAGRLRLPQATVTVSAEPDIQAAVYRTELERALDNLATNAHRYGRGADGALVLDISLQRDGRDLLLSVADRGPGIAAGEQDRLLRPFERGDGARSEARGAGLGLAIVERVARLHGGTLRLLARDGGGLRVELRWPLQA